MYQSDARGFERIRLEDQNSNTSLFDDIIPRYNYSCSAVGNGLCDRAGRMQQIDWRPSTGANPLDVSDMAYSAVGSLTFLKTPAGGYFYGYDHNVRRVVKKQPLGNDRVRFRYGLGANVLEESVFENGLIPHTLQYVYFGGMKVVALHTATDGTETKLRLHNDRMGTVRMVSKKDVAIARVIMNPWGQASDGTVVGVPVYDDPSWIGLPVQHRRAGQYEDVETRLIENRYRTLVPELGGYVSPDPLHSFSLRIDGVQTYNYAGARPSSTFDPDGRTGLDTYSNCVARYGPEMCGAPPPPPPRPPVGPRPPSGPGDAFSAWLLCKIVGICESPPPQECEEEKPREPPISPPPRKKPDDDPWETCFEFYTSCKSDCLSPRNLPGRPPNMQGQHISTCLLACGLDYNACVTSGGF